ncbi:hypothetical protein [Tessaracoccus sp.]
MDTEDDALLAPASAPETDAEPVDDEGIVEDGSTSDSQGIVRVWVSDGRITKVRVSPQWHARLGRRSLADCFTQALLMAQMAVADVEPGRVNDHGDVDFSRLPPVSEQSLAAFQTAFDEVEQRWGQALQRQDAKEPASRVAVTGKSSGVTVSLNRAGLAESVSFDKVWLESAQAGTICTQVMRAAENAHAKFVPGEDDRGELDDIEEEHELLLAAFKAMLNPKEQS